MKIIKDEIEIFVETPLTEIRKDLSNLKIDFSSINFLKGDKNLLTQAFREVMNESINE